jgi:hypothetical protein
MAVLADLQADRCAIGHRPITRTGVSARLPEPLLNAVLAQEGREFRPHPRTVLAVHHEPSRWRASGHAGATLSANQTIEAENAIYGGISRLAAELETIAADAQRNRFVDLLRRSGLTDEQHAAVASSAAFGPLTAGLRRAEAYHHDLETLLPRIVGQHGLDDADDIAAVLKYRVDQLASAPRRGKRGLKPRLIAGLIPEPLGPMNDDDRRAIAERKQLIESRARALAEQALAARSSWTRRLGAPGLGATDRETWLDAVSAVAAYRDRYAIDSDLLTGGRSTSNAEEHDRQWALRAARTASATARHLPGQAQAVDISAISSP